MNAKHENQLSQKVVAKQNEDREQEENDFNTSNKPSSMYIKSIELYSAFELTFL